MTDTDAAIPCVVGMPVAPRALFDQVVAQYRAQITAQHEDQRRTAGGHGPPVDIDAIDHEVLSTLLQGAAGTATADGRGVVPMLRSDQDEIVWYSVDVAVLTRIPDGAAFTVGQHGDRMTRTRLLGIVALIVGTLLVLGWMVVGGSTAAPAPVLPAIQINDQPLAGWAVTALVLPASGADQPIILPVQPRATLPAHAESDTPTAFWAQDALWPLSICIVAGETVPDLTAGATVRLRGVGETPERIYTLQATAPSAPAAPDLILTRCGERDAAGTRFGVLRDTAPLPAAAVGESAPLDATTTITLESIVGIGPGEDERVPATQQHVVVTVSGATGLDWPHAAATLLVASGHRSATPDMQADPTTGRTVIRYSGVPLMTQPTAVAWQITSPTTGQVVRWRTTLAPPPDRATVLAQALVVVDITADPVAPGAPLTLQLILSNRGPQPLQLTPDDIGLHHGTTPVALTAADGLDTPIRTDGRITVTLTVPVDPTQALTLTLGPQVYQIRMSTETEGG